MEPALMAVCKDIRLGKILIQTNHDTEEPEVRVTVVVFEEETTPVTSITDRPVTSADLL